MVTILHPGETVPLRPDPMAEEPRAGQERGFMAYSMPFPGVKYYAFEPRAKTEYPLPDVGIVRETLTAKLIDERVILI